MVESDTVKLDIHCGRWRNHGVIKLLLAKVEEGSYQSEMPEARDILFRVYAGAWTCCIMHSLNLRQ